MRLDREEMVLFHAACADPGNVSAQELMNVFGVTSAEKVLESMPMLPMAIISDVVNQIWQAIEEARQREGFQSRFVVNSRHG